MKISEKEKELRNLQKQMDSIALKPARQVTVEDMWAYDKLLARRDRILRELKRSR